MPLISHFISNHKELKKLASILPMVSIRSTKDFFLECDAYSLIIPVVTSSGKSSQFSVVERCVLRFLNINSDYSDAELAQKLCLGITGDGGATDTSFIRIIRSRLKDLGLIEDSGTLTTKGLEAIQIMKEPDETEVSEINIQVFAIRQLNNMLLPYIWAEEQESERFDTEDRKITMRYGSAGKESTIRGTFVTIPRKKQKGTVSPKAPTVNEIIKIIRIYNRMVTSEKRIKLSEQRGFVISTSPSSVIVHMKAMLQNGNAMTPIISDGFSCNIDGLLEYLQNNTDIIKKLYEKDKVIMNQGTVAVEEKILRREYSEIYLAMKKMNVSQGQSPDGTMLANKTNSQLISNCYAALEWTLHYYLAARNDLSTVLSVMKTKSATANQNMILEYAQKMRLQKPETFRSLSGADGANLEKWLNSRRTGEIVPSCKTLLPVLIAYAYMGDEPHLKNMLSQMPDFLVFVENLHTHAAKSKHDGIIAISEKETRAFVDQVQNVIHNLLPEIQFGQTVSTQVAMQNASGYIINTAVDLFQEIGWNTWNILRSDSQRLLLELAPENDKDPERRLSSAQFVLTISQILETVLAAELRDLHITKKYSKRELLAHAEHILKKPLPEGYSYINEGYLAQALKRTKTTLNPMALVFFCFGEESMIQALAKADFQTYIMQIGEYRSHGNTVNLELEDDLRSKLRKQLFHYLKILGG